MLQPNLAGCILADLSCLLLVFAIGGEPIHEEVKIHEMPIEFRSVDAGKPGLPSHSHPATAAHSCTIDHHWIKRNNSVHPKRASQVHHRPHHGNWPHGVNHVDICSG